MGILSNIFHKIFPSSHPAVQNPQASNSASMQSATPGQATQPQRSAPPGAPMDIVDVEAILSAKPQAGALNWRSSIVDLLKLLNLDSSLQARQQLAHELDYQGDTSDSATMNQWLHRQVMNRLAANGGKVPADLRD
ncbi:MAG: DUF3597 domain-containing protein [Pseudomonadota bacterium]